jgi:TPR repeat protein
VEEACIRLANLLLEENNPVADPEKALMLLWRTCESKPPSLDSCHRYGEALSEGVGQTSPNPEAAMMAFQTACEGGLQRSCVQLALALTDQEPSDRFAQSPQMEQAGSLLRDACETGDIDGCFALGELERDGRLEGASSVRAAMLFRRVCSEDPARGCFEVAQLMEKGLVKARKNEVASLYTVACENGRTEACTRRDQLPNSGPN